jgi:hypothetical protein
MTEARAEGERSIAVGDQVIHSLLISGDNNRVFVGDYEPLAEAYLRPASVFSRVRLERFAGREWLATRVDAFLDSQDRGCLILEAGAGLGKTTFLARLVQERGYIHHFVELAPGQAGVAVGLRSLAAQLILAWSLGSYAADEVLPAAANRPDFLQSLLFEAAKRRDEIAPGRKIVLAVDALDESFASPGQNVMGLPRVLPPGVFLFVSQRPIPVSLVVEGPREVIRLEAAEPANLEDMRAYLQASTRIAAVAQALQESGLAAERYTESLLEKCQGVWIYLHYVVWEIERKERSVLDLSSLPDGIWQYYGQYWERWRARDGWQSLSLPLLAALGAAQEDLPLDLLCSIHGVADRAAARDLLKEQWRPFLVVSGSAEPRFRLYHASLREFLDGRADLSALTSSEQALAEELAGAVRDAHRRFAAWALAGWGGLDQSLPGLHTPEGRGLGDGYAFRHAVHHLRAAGDLETLGRLLMLEWTVERTRPITRSGWRGWLDRLRGIHREAPVQEKANPWYTAREESGTPAGYVDDLQRTGEAAREAAERARAAGGPAPALALETLAALLAASVGSLAGNIGPRLLAAVVKNRIWTPAHALAYALQAPEPLDRVACLSALVPYLGEPEQAKALAVVFAVLQAPPTGCPPDDWQREVIERFPVGMPDAFLRRVLAEMPAPTKVQDDPTPSWSHQQVEALSALLPKVPSSFLPDIKAVLSRLSPPEAGARAWIAVLKASPPEERPALAVHAARLAESITLQPTGTQIRLELAEFLPEQERQRILSKAREHFERTYQLGQRAELLLLLLAQWPREPSLGYEELANRALDEALSAGHSAAQIFPKLIPLLNVAAEKRARAMLHEIQDPRLRSSLQIGLAVATARAGQGEAAIAEVRAIDRSYGHARAEAIAGLAPYLEPRLFGEALAVVKEIWASARRMALDSLAPRLSEPFLRKALAASLEVGDNSTLLQAQLGLAAELARAGKGQSLLGWAAQIPWEGGEVISRLAPYLSPEQQTPVVDIARTLQPEGRAKALLGLATASEDPRQRKRWLAQALTAARKIGSPAEKLIALCRLLPHLDGAVLRRTESQILRSMRSLAGDPRLEWRVADGVALASPGLSQDGLRSALNILLSFDESSGNRQTALDQISRYLGEPLAQLALRNRRWGSLLDKVVVFPVKMEPSLQATSGDSSGPASRLMDSIRQASNEKRAKLILEALAVARAARSPEERTAVAAGLLPFLSMVREEIFLLGLLSALAISDRARRAAALERMQPFARPGLRLMIRYTVDELRGLPAEDAVAKNWAELAALEPRERIYALAGLILRLPLEAAEAELRALEPLAASEPKLYADLVVALPGELSAGFWQGLLGSRLQELRIPPRAELLSRLLPRLPSSFLPHVWPLVDAYADSEARPKALQALMARLSDLSDQDAYALWSSLLRRAPERTREELARDLGVLAPLLARLGGTQALQKVFEALEAARRWWP